MTEPKDRLQAARRAAGYETAAEAANAFGWKEPTYMSHENGSRGIRKEVAKRYAAALHVSPEWILLGVGQGPKGNPVGRPADLKRVAAADIAAKPKSKRGSGHPELDDMVLVDELDLRAASGPAFDLVEVTEETYDQKVVGKFGFPKQGFREIYGADPGNVVLITVVGDSMEPTLLPGQKVLVDTSDRFPTPPGIFVVWDGFGLVLKRVSLIPHSDPPTVRISSDNSHYPPYERILGEAHIQARVIGEYRRR